MNSLILNKDKKWQATGIFFLLMMFFACSGPDLRNEMLQKLNGDPFILGSEAGGKIIVAVIISPDCPVCINYTLTLNRLVDSLHNKPVIFYAVIPGNMYTKAEVDTFIARYQFKVPVLFDKELRFTKKAQATTTPEAIVIDTKGHIAYMGAIDNWLYETGRKRPYPTDHYLKNAINAALSEQIPDPARTEALGCMIEDL